MTNTQMKAGRFLRWAKARQTYARIVETISNGGSVIIGSHTHARQYKHAEQFKCGKDGVYVARGKNWDSLVFSRIVFAK